MATTTLSIVSNRHGPRSYLQAQVTSVALDATVSESFIFPAGYGQLLIEAAGVVVGDLSGAYVAPTPAYDGVRVSVASAGGSGVSDQIGTMRYVNYATGSTRPAFAAMFDLFNRVLMRQDERVVVQLPIIAGAGVTGSVTLNLRGIRIMTN